jgi:hypothetical protein
MNDDDVQMPQPREPDDFPDSGMPRRHDTEAGAPDVLSRAEAALAGVSTTPKLLYGEASGASGEQKERFATTEE